MTQSAFTMTAPGIQPGERAPDLVLPDASGTPVRWYAQAGGVPAVVVVATEDSEARIQALADDLTDRDGYTVHVMVPATLSALETALPLLADPDGRTHKAYRTGDRAMVFLLDPNLRVCHSLSFDDGPEVARAVAAFVVDQHEKSFTGREIALQAPVLTVPNVLTPAQCAELMQVWEREGNDATGVEDSTDGVRGERLQTKAKRRRDHVVSDAARTQVLAQAIGRRVMPELRRTFNYRATRFEGFKIACYEGEDRGFFSAHRDNLSPTTAHRRFALTLNLNSEFAGGQLRFPEYGHDLYRPPPGAALLFGCSLLHEVMDVTAGRRFVLLSFLFADEQRRS